MKKELDSVFAESVKQKYKNVFFGTLTEEEKAEVRFDGYMWHAFSYEKIPAQEGIEAVKAFRNKEKRGGYILFQHRSEVLEWQTLTYDELLDIIMETAVYYGDEIYVEDTECYVTDKDFTWTFMCTHETYIEGVFELEKEEGRDFDMFPSIGPFFYEPTDKNNPVE
ncbi:MAG: DUF4275 family protein [Clostridiales bacterium]|nr:DUF4275 family protein [Clostridiales bacterium]